MNKNRRTTDCLRVRFPVRSLATLCLLLSILSLTACEGALDLLENTPQGVVRRHYEAIEEKDADKFLETLAPEKRERLINYIGWMLLKKAGDVRFHDMSFEVTEKDGDLARVRATGKVRILATERPWEAAHDVCKVDGMWYVSTW
mgnify:CR=1 FL=1